MLETSNKKNEQFATYQQYIPIKNFGKKTVGCQQEMANMGEKRQRIPYYVVNLLFLAHGHHPRNVLWWHLVDINARGHGCKLNGKERRILWQAIFSRNEQRFR